MWTGSLAWLITQQVHRYRKDDGSNSEYDLEEVSYLTGFVLGIVVWMLSTAALFVHVLCIRRMRFENQIAHNFDQQHANKQPDLSFWEWYFYPELVPVPSQRRSKVVLHFATVYQRVRWPAATRRFVLAPSLALLGILTIRLLVDVKYFHSNPAFLDFGWKNGYSPEQEELNQANNVFVNKEEESVGESSASSFVSVERVIAFSVDYMTYIHALLGLTGALMAFPVVQELLSFPKGTRPVWPFFVHVGPLVCSLYSITYQFAALASKSPRTFATSLYCRYALEWTVGFLVGMAIGNVWTAVVLYRRIQRVPRDDHENDEESRTDSSGDGGVTLANSDDDTQNTKEGEVEEKIESSSLSFSPPWYQFWLPDPPSASLAENDTNDHPTTMGAPSVCAHLMHTVLGFLYWITIGWVAVGMGVTWHGSAYHDDTGTQQQDQHAEIGIFVVLCLIPFLIGAFTIHR